MGSLYFYDKHKGLSSRYDKGGWVGMTPEFKVYVEKEKHGEVTMADINIAYFLCPLDSFCHRIAFLL